ncbi:hypothetical protein [Bradyrhizobium cenepequi]|uniref:hypothetical protein n=1 Tax=Bradyrhizobium cenepequi TaxID=2821403 RepID=UPI001CE2A264|nr:hypothetical protein [Bradyrhizobium cenepequi]MCA6108073.1 hypothetical protein [Bradyrhizobium cenepequi]
MKFDPKEEAQGCTNELFYRDCPTPKPLALTDAVYIAETIENSLREAFEAGKRAATPVWPDVAEDDPEVLIAARAIAEHGIGRPWDDFKAVDAYGVDHGDLIEYGRAAVAALRAQGTKS